MSTSQGCPVLPPVVVACGAISLGAALLVLAGIAWIRRKTVVPRQSWVARIVHITPSAAGILGFVLSTANLKVTVANAAAGNVIGGAEQLGVLGTVATLGAYILIASSTVIVPIAGYLIAAERVERALTSARAWVDRRAAVLVIVVSGRFRLGADDRRCDRHIVISVAIRRRARRSLIEAI